MPADCLAPKISFTIKDLEYIQRFKIIYIIIGPLDPQTMILMGPRALGMGPIIDVFICWKF